MFGKLNLSEIMDDDLKLTVLVSLGLHVLIGILLTISWPYLSPPFEMPDQTVVVELVNITDITNLPKAAKKPTPEPPKVEEKKAEEPPPPPPPPAPQPITAAEPPPPEVLEPIETKKPEPLPKEEPKKVDKKEPTKKTPLLDKTAKPQEDDFLSVIKSVEKMDKPAPKKDDLDLADLKKDLQKAQGVTTKPHNSSMPLSVSQIDAIRAQIEKCWNIPAGARMAESLIVELEVKLDPSGKVMSAKALDSGKLSDPFYRAASESAQRAVLNPQCNSFKLPADKYDQWKEMVLRFDPSQMLVY